MNNYIVEFLAYNNVIQSVKADSEEEAIEIATDEYCYYDGLDDVKCMLIGDED